MFPSMPDPALAAANLRSAIATNKRPTLLLFDFFASPSAASNIVFSMLQDYREIVRILNSPAGRKYLHAWLDDTLAYCLKVAETPK